MRWTPNLPTPAAGYSPLWTVYLYYDARKRLSVNWPFASIDLALKPASELRPNS